MSHAGTEVYDAFRSKSIKATLIDDAREFTGHAYPMLSSFLAAFDNQSDYQAEVSADIIRVTPRI
jgi:hypothetical protein